MSNVQLQVRPRRVRASGSLEPPPFRFDVGQRARAQATGVAAAVRAPLRAAWLVLCTAGRLIDAAFFLVALTAWCALHLAIWSYAFEMGPAANCFSLPCPEWLRAKVLLACVGLAVLSFLAARGLRRFGHRATAFMLLVLVTLDVSALLLLGIRSMG